MCLLQQKTHPLKHLLKTFQHTYKTVNTAYMLMYIVKVLNFNNVCAKIKKAPNMASNEASAWCHNEHCCSPLIYANDSLFF